MCDSSSRQPHLIWQGIFIVIVNAYQLVTALRAWFLYGGDDTCRDIY